MREALIPYSGRKYSHTNSSISAMTVIAQDGHLTAGAWAACGKNGYPVFRSYRFAVNHLSLANHYSL